MRYSLRSYGSDAVKNPTIEKFEDLLGTTIVKIERTEVGDGEGLVFWLEDGRKAAMGYEQDCCASCNIEDIAGELDDLLNSPVIRAEQNGSEDNPPVRPDKDDDGYNYSPDSETWTFYRLQTAKGLVVIRWYGSSNGYYSETPSFGQVK